MTTRRLVGGATLLLLVAAIVVGAGHRPVDSTWLGLDHLDVVFYIVVGLVMLFGLAVIASARSFRQAEPEPRNRRQFVPLLILLLAAVLLRPQLNELIDSFAAETATGPTVAVDDQAVGGVQSTTDGQVPVAQLTDVLLLVAGILAVAGVWQWSRLRGRDEAVASHNITTTDTDESALVVALETASDQLLDDGDPRTAVLRAYATIESELARRGMARQRAETPREYLDRVTGRLHIDPETLIELGALYEVARFSDHDITLDDQRRAAAALTATSSQLRSLT